MMDKWSVVLVKLCKILWMAGVDVSSQNADDSPLLDYIKIRLLVLLNDITFLWSGDLGFK